MDYSSENEYLNSYTITSQREIVALLRSIEEKRQLIRMLAHGGTEASVTSILAVESDAIIMDSARDSSTNQRIIEADKVSFETTLDKIRILFASTQVTSCQMDDRPALRIAIPESLIRLQRREFYRLNTPITNPVRCIIPLPSSKGKDVQIVTVALQDISCGGIAISDDDGTLDDTTGCVYKSCTIALPEVGTITTSLVVANSQEQTLLNNKRRRRIGCAFIELPNTMLNKVQRYIGKLEREMNAKLNGLD